MLNQSCRLRSAVLRKLAGPAVAVLVSSPADRDTVATQVSCPRR
jgi:hypothetical protein